ncbi:MAG TPA: neutral zinc metallopeptidase [Polyangiales bacterium]|jgi:predicted metalloprotease|nr:neutral zinc metallopeptidase [Polyangiales bacterium]
MRYDQDYKSDNVDDRRGDRPPALGGGGLSGGGANLLFVLFQRFGIGGVVVGAVVLYLANNFSSRSGSQGPATAAELESEKPLVSFVSFVLDDAQKSWSQTLTNEGKPYRMARLVLFRDRTQSGCGMGQAAMGPFYCPNDEKVYIDLGFYEELKQQLGAPGDFAQAYVIAHELGHHVQHILGVDERVHDAPSSQQTGDGGLSVRLELQADCYAGVWAHDAQERKLLEVGDVDEALNAATKIGDDALQKQSSGAVRPETFTHGTSAQRHRWFQRGFESGAPNACDTFGAREL